MKPSFSPNGNFSSFFFFFFFFLSDHYTCIKMAIFLLSLKRDGRKYIFEALANTKRSTYLPMHSSSLISIFAVRSENRCLQYESNSTGLQTLMQFDRSKANSNQHLYFDKSTEQDSWNYFLETHSYNNVVLKNNGPDETEMMRIMIWICAFTVCSKIHFSLSEPWYCMFVSMFFLLRKHAYSNILNWNFTTKKENFQIKKPWYFSYLCSKHRLWVLVRGSREYPQFMFWAEIIKIMYTPKNPSFDI